MPKRFARRPAPNHAIRQVKSEDKQASTVIFGTRDVLVGQRTHLVPAKTVFRHDRLTAASGDCGVVAPAFSLLIGQKHAASGKAELTQHGQDVYHLGTSA